MHILWIATKPPWPPSDGGRLVQWLTLRTLAARGVRFTVVAPRGAGAEEPRELAAQAREVGSFHLVPARPRPLPLALLAAWLTGRSLALTRHDLGAVRRRVAEVLDSPGSGGRGLPGAVDAVHGEQLQAWPQTAPAVPRGLPRVLRAQNVESDLWAAMAHRGGLHGRMAGRQARRLARIEGRWVAEAEAAVALTQEDAARLAELSGGPVEVVAPPFPALLPAAETALPGEPPVVLLGSSGWLPNRDAETWFLGEIWPRVAAALPGAVLHVFGGESAPGGGAGGERQVRHPPPADSRQAFAAGSVLVVPLRIASGIRMKVLEAWARGVPVVATPAAAAGLAADDGRELLLARDAEGFTAALVRLAGDRGLAGRLVAAGRRALSTRHDPARIAERWLEIYRRVSIRH
jgi:hypothetical protein